MGNVFLISFVFLVIFPACKLQKTELSGEQGTRPTLSKKTTLAEYEKLCSDANVIIPSQPLSNSNFWQAPIHSDTSSVHFAGVENTADLYLTQPNLNGGCVLAINNTRLKPQEVNKRTGKPIKRREEALAICWSSSGNVCFWEDLTAPADTTELMNSYLIHRTQQTVYPTMDTGEDPDPCTNCHRGENIFVGHGDLGDLVFKNLPHVELKSAVGRPDWDLGQVFPENIQCASSCHLVAQPSEAYCKLALQMMTEGLMLGTKFGIGKSRKATADMLNQTPGAEECAAWTNFLTTCLTLTESEKYKPTSVNLGKCMAMQTRTQ